ncbi:MAG: hypothetical protein M3315_01170, partial [Actinomycetota bacterium]|nr:hypothetical protein [Actinomycetota bacterium]
MRKGIRINIPEGWRFSALQLQRDPQTGDIAFSIPALKEVIHPDDVDWLMSHPEGHMAEVLVKLYKVAVEQYGA